MRPITRKIFLLCVFFAVAFVIVQPYNSFCNMTNKCQPFYFSYYIPSFESGRKFDVNFQVRNKNEALDFRVFSAEKFTTRTNAKNSVEYSVKNNGDHVIKFRQMFFTSPKSLEKHLTRYDCRCNRQITIKPGEEINMRFRFLIRKSIESNKEVVDGRTIKPEITLGYEVI